MKKFSLYTLFAIALIGGAALLSFKSGQLIQSAYREVLPDTAILKAHYPVAVGKDGPKILYKFQRTRPDGWVSLKSLPKHVIGAVLMAEDSEFFQHKGYSPEGIRLALEHNSKPGVKVKRGGSTITQQVVKNLFLTPEKTMTRKVRELLLAVELERKFSKAKILETYFNIAEWGPGIYGIGRASEKYFQKPAANLSPKEAAVLAFMLPNPNRYRHSIKDGELTEFAARRVGSILERMWKTGKISDEEYSSSGSENTDELPSSL